MLIVAFVQWWYGPGWSNAASRLMTRIQETYLIFSVPSLLSTLFAPWRRIVSAPGRSIGDRFRAGIDNLISRVVGLIVRLMALTAAFLIILFYLIFGGLMLVVWPAAPLLGPILIVGGLVF
jgi:hypothetical protein